MCAVSAATSMLIASPIANTGASAPTISAIPPTVSSAATNGAITAGCRDAHAVEALFGAGEVAELVEAVQQEGQADHDADGEEGEVGA